MRKTVEQLKRSVREMATKRVVRITILLSVIFFLLSVAIPYFYLFPEVAAQIAVPLHYNIHFGVDLFGQPWRVFTSGFVGVAVLAVNTILAVIFWSKQRILSYGLLCTTAVIEVVACASSVFVTLLVLSFL